MIQLWVRLFSMNLETYARACSLLVANPCTSIAMMWVHLMGEELKKQAQPCRRDRARTCEIPDDHTRATTQHVQPILQPVQRVTFNLDCNRVYDLPPEDRKSDWIQIAADRFRFQRRIRHLENLLRPLLKQHSQ
jgi:hypothetical protein